MFRSLMTIIRELYLYLTKVIFMLTHSVKLRRYIYIYIYMYIYVCVCVCVLCVCICVYIYIYTQIHTHNTHAALGHAATSANIYIR